MTSTTVDGLDSKVDESEKIREIFSKPASSRDSIELLPILEWLRARSTLFTTLDTESLCSVAKTISLVHVKADQVLVHQGDIGDSFYIIVRGSAAVHAKRAEDGDGPITEPIAKDVTIARGPKERARFGQELCTLKSGRCFGELSIVASNSERNATVISNEACILLCIMRKDYEQFVQKEVTCELLNRSMYVKNHPLFKSWPTTYRNLLAENLQIKTIRHGEFVVKQGENVESAFFVIKGQAKLSMNPKAHHRQFPKQMASLDQVQPQASDDEEEEEDYIANRYKRLSLLDQRKTKRNGGFHAAEVLRREIPICTISAQGLIGDVEAIMDLDRYTVSVQCIEELTVYQIDKHSFIRVIVKKNPETFERMRAVIKDKIAYRNSSILGGIPIYHALLACFAKTKARDERERLLQLYGQARKESRKPANDFLDRARRGTNQGLHLRGTDKPDAEKSDEAEGGRKLKAGVLMATGRFAGKLVRRRKEKNKSKGAADTQYTADDYKDLKKKMQALGKMTGGNGWSG